MGQAQTRPERHVLSAWNHRIDLDALVSAGVCETLAADDPHSAGSPRVHACFRPGESGRPHLRAGCSRRPTRACRQPGCGDCFRHDAGACVGFRLVGVHVEYACQVRGLSPGQGGAGRHRDRSQPGRQDWRTPAAAASGTDSSQRRCGSTALAFARRGAVVTTDEQPQADQEPQATDHDEDDARRLQVEPAEVCGDRISQDRAAATTSCSSRAVVRGGRSWRGSVRRLALPSADAPNYRQHGYHRDGDHENQDENLERADAHRVPAWAQVGSR